VGDVEGEPQTKDGVGTTLTVGEDSHDTLLTCVALIVTWAEVENVTISALLEGIED
jgi:hypothetical protein